MAKQANTTPTPTNGKSTTATRTSAARQNGQRAASSPTSTNGARKDPHRRGSVTKPVKKTPWTAIISGGIGAIALIAVVVIVLMNNSNSGGLQPDPAKAPKPAPSPVAGSAIPDFSVKAKDGTMLNKAGIVGKPTVVVFFASWCPHCQAEAPLLKQVAADNPDVQVIMMGVYSRESADDIYGFTQKYNLPFTAYTDPSVNDAGKAAAVWGIYQYPTIYAVDKSGTIRDTITGEAPNTRVNELFAKSKG